MRMRQSEYCSYRDLRVLLCSWNIDACKPADLDSSEDAHFLDEWLTTMENPDIVSIGIQEIVDLESKSQSASTSFYAISVVPQGSAAPFKERSWLMIWFARSQSPSSLQRKSLHPKRLINFCNTNTSSGMIALSVP